MPGPDLQSEQTLVLLEDEVFDFDDLTAATTAETQQATPQQPPPPPMQPRMAETSTAEQDARDTRAMIASMLDGERPLMTMSAVDTTPSAYLEYLRIIVNCARLLRQPAMPPDLRQSVATLLGRARPLFCANALNLIVQTVSAVSAGEHQQQPVIAVPAFWSATHSQHECRLWMDLVETLLFFWADGGGGVSGDAAFVESFALGLLDRLAEIRAAYAATAGASTRAAADDARQRAELLASELSRRLRPRHLVALSSASISSNGSGGSRGSRRKQSPAARSSKRVSQLQSSPKNSSQQQQQPLLVAAFACFLEAAGASLPQALTLESAKDALETVTIEQAASALRLHQPENFADNLSRLQRLRLRLDSLRPPQDEGRLDQPALRARLDSAVSAAGIREPADLADLLATLAAYASSVVDFESAWQRAVVRDADSMAPFLLGRLSRVLAGNIGPARAVPGCWETLPEQLRSQLEQQSARRLASVTSAAAAEPDVVGEELQRPSAATVEFDVVVWKQTEIQPEFLPPSFT